VLLVTSFVMTLIAVGVAVLGFLNPSAVPLCFQPERSGQTVVVCPTQQSDLVDQQAHSVLDTVRRKKRAS
jgi:type IV secretory pathway TrbF-like protein